MSVSCVGDKLKSHCLLCNSHSLLQHWTYSGVGGAAQLSPSPRPFCVVIFDSSIVILSEKQLLILHLCLFFSWTKLTERFFKNTPWPEAEAIAPQVGNGESSTFSWVVRERRN